MIVNEVLCTLIHRLNANAVDNLNNLLFNFYNDDEIISAKSKKDIMGNRINGHNW